MGSAHSKSAKLARKGNGGLKGLIEENDNEIGSNDNDTDNKWRFIRKMNAQEAVIRESLPMDQREATTSSRTNECSQSSEDGQKFDVFLSHSGKQKNFVRQLYRDLTDQGVSCFFDQDPESLPKGQDFPSRIFGAAETCKVAVLIISKGFLESKWPMLELSFCVEAKKEKNPNLNILPLFFLISPDALKFTKEKDIKWQQLDIRREQRAPWQDALDAIRRINGLPLGEGDDEVKFRDEIVKEIWRILPTPSPRYHVRGMQGEARMCKKLANFFSRVRPNKDGIKIAGLYGIAGQGKTSLGKAFCNFKLGEFEGKICHLEFSRGDAFEYMKLALKCLTHYPKSHLQRLIDKDQAQDELYRRVKGQRVLLVLDNVTEESIEEVMYYLKAEWGQNSWILLSARSVDVLRKHFNLDSWSCMRVPGLEAEEAVRILLEGKSPAESTLGADDRGFALKCAKRCLFKESTPTFHPLSLKAFGGYLFTKYRLNLSKWVDEVDGMVDRHGDGLDDVFVLLGKAFDDMRSEYRTIFLLLTVYKLPNMSPDKVTEWMAIICNKEVSFIAKAVEDLRQKDFIEEIEPEIRIHDLFIEFAQSKAKEMGRWLWRKGTQHSTRGLISQDNAGFELAKLEQCMYRRIAPKYLGNLVVLQLVDVQNISKLDLGPMDSLRSITLSNCEDLAALDGMEKLLDLAWLQISGVHPMFKLPELSSFEGLQHIEIDIAGSHGLDQLGDLTNCLHLIEIKVRCPSLSEFPRVNGLRFLKKVEFSLSDKVTGPLDCTGCGELQRIVLDRCSQMTASPILTGCNNLSNIVLYECGITEPPDLTCCVMLKDVDFFNLKNLVRVPNFSFLRELRRLRLDECTRIQDPPDIRGCHKMKVLNLLHNDNMEGLPEMGGLSLLQEIKLSWLSVDKVTNEAIGPDSLEVDGDGKFCRYEDLQNLTGVSVPEPLKELQWLKGKVCLVKQYFRGVRLYYSITAPCLSKIVLEVDIGCEKCKIKMMKSVAGIDGVDSIAVDRKENKMIVIGKTDPQSLVRSLTLIKKKCEAFQSLVRSLKLIKKCEVSRSLVRSLTLTKKCEVSQFLVRSLKLINKCGVCNKQNKSSIISIRLGSHERGLGFIF